MAYPGGDLHFGRCLENHLNICNVMLRYFLVKAKEYNLLFMRLSVITPVKYPSIHMDNVYTIVEKCKELELQITVVLDTTQPSPDLESDIIKLENLGARLVIGDYKSPGKARNAGMRETEGGWITFWDADDNPFLERYLKAIEQSDYDTTLIFGSYEVHQSNRHKSRSIAATTEVTGLAMNPGLWRFIFRRDLLDDVSYTDLSLGEDQVFLAHLFSKHPKWKMFEPVLYSYVVGHNGQLTSSTRSRRAGDQFKATTLIGEIVLRNEPDCFYCENILAMRWKLSLGCLRNLGLWRTIEGVSFWKSRSILFRNLLSVGLRRNLRFLWALR